jgi:hypothetical protein
MAVGTGFGQLFRGIGEPRSLDGLLVSDSFPGQVGGVGIASAIFQYHLDSELSARIKTPDAEEVNFTALTRRPF